MTISSPTYNTPCHISSFRSHTPLTFHPISPRLQRPIMICPFSIQKSTFYRLIFRPSNRLLFLVSITYSPLTNATSDNIYALKQPKSRIYKNTTYETRPTKDYVRIYQQNMRNKPNFPDAQMNVNIYSTKVYKNETAFRQGKNKPNSNPIKPNLPDTQMSVNSILSKDYKRNDIFAVKENKANSNPIKACPERSRMGQFQDSAPKRVGRRISCLWHFFR